MLSLGLLHFASQTLLALPSKCPASGLPGLTWSVLVTHLQWSLLVYVVVAASVILLITLVSRSKIRKASEGNKLIFTIFFFLDRLGMKILVWLVSPYTYGFIWAASVAQCVFFAKRFSELKDSGQTVSFDVFVSLVSLVHAVMYLFWRTIKLNDKGAMLRMILGKILADSVVITSSVIQG
jgi:hypothetical protein